MFVGVASLLIREPEKVDVFCPKCDEKNEALWFPRYSNTYQITGTTGIASHRTDIKKETIEGNCKCGYKFKLKDLD